MKVLICTMGTRGDVQPYVALGKGLVAAGHQVAINTSVTFEPFIRSHGLDYAFLDDGILDFMKTDLGKGAMENTSTLWESVLTARKVMPAVAAIQRRHFRQRWQAIQQTKPDLILFHPKAGGVQDFADQIGARCMVGFYLPILVKTSERPAAGVPDLKLGGWYNRLTYSFIQTAIWAGSKKFINEWRKEVGLQPRRGRAYLRTPAGQSVPVMYCYSPHVIPQPADWPADAAVTGYWFLDESEKDWRPPPELQRFLDAGEPPVYIGFGSIFGRDPVALTRTVLDAVSQAGVRAILAAGWGGIRPGEVDLPETVFPIQTAPHDWLLPRVSAVVHHGGCGTTAAGLRAGRPTVICPFFGDQPFWGARVHALGVGPEPIPQKRLTAPKLAAAIRQATRDPSMRAASSALGERIRAEDGVGNAVRFIEHHMQRP